MIKDHVNRESKYIWLKKEFLAEEHTNQLDRNIGKLKLEKDFCKKNP